MDEVEKAGQASFRALTAAVRIPGVSTLSATDDPGRNQPGHEPLSTAGHLVAWAGLCPGSERERRQAQVLASAKRRALAQDNAGPVRDFGRQKKDSYFKAQFQRLKSRRGPQKAICAVAAAMLTTIYHMLKDGTQFQDLGAASLRSTPSRGQGQASGRPTHQTRIHGPASAPGRGGLMSAARLHSPALAVRAHSPGR